MLKRAFCIVVAVVTMILAGAGPAIPGGARKPSTTQPADAFERIRAAQAMPGYARGDVLVQSFGNPVRRLTPLITSDAYASTIQDYIFQTLIDRDPDTMECRPLIAESWTIQDNSKAYDDFVAAQIAAGKTLEQAKADPNLPRAIAIMFKIRKGVVFSDGEPMTADDVKFTFDWTMNPRVAAPRFQSYYQHVKAVEIVDDHEVRFVFAEPYFEALELAGGMAILPRHFYSKYTPAQFNDSTGLVLGSGPYRMNDPTGWKPGDPIELVRNERFWGPAPAFDKLVYKVILDDDARLAAFKKREFDLLPASSETFVKLMKDEALVNRTRQLKYESPSGGYRYIAWNQVDKDGRPTVFADKRVRQAMTLLIDRDQLVRKIMLGEASIATGPFNPLSKQYDPSVKPWPCDVKKAIGLLRQAGLDDSKPDHRFRKPDGNPLVVRFTYPSVSPNYEMMVSMIKDDLARAGIDLEPEPLEFSVLVERLANRDFEAITLGWTAGVEMDIFQMFHSSQTTVDGDNFINYKNPALDTLIEQARRTMDEPARFKLWQACHRTVHEDQPYTFLFFGKSLVFVDNRIKNVRVTRLGLNSVDEWFVPKADQLRK